MSAANMSTVRNVVKSLDCPYGPSIHAEYCLSRQDMSRLVIPWRGRTSICRCMPLCELSECHQTTKNGWLCHMEARLTQGTVTYRCCPGCMVNDRFNHRCRWYASLRTSWSSVMVRQTFFTDTFGVHAPFPNPIFRRQRTMNRNEKRTDHTPMPIKMYSRDVRRCWAICLSRVPATRMVAQKWLRKKTS
jgi:hypothetical protein